MATLMTGALQSCDDDYFNGGEGTKVTINATTAFSNTTSRAVFEEDTYFESGDIVITNYCFLLFGDDGALIDLFDINALPYVAELSKPVVGKNYHAFLLGNVDKETLEKSGAITTIADLQSRTFEINRMYNLPKEEEKSKFTWSSYLPFSLSAKNLNFILNPNVAKITAKITNSSSESVIKSVRVKNVVNKVGYAQNALNEYSPDYVTNVSTPTFIKYDIETFDTPIATGESKTISWYVPQNIQGDGTRKPAGDVDANETYLHGGIPDNATYVEIDGVRPADNVTASYRVYPGIKKDGEIGYADMTNFDVKADVIYNLNITISNDGIADESNITNGYKPNNESTATAKIKLPENSNCYMIHPIGDRIADVTVYELPISRVNQYWTTVAGEPGTEADDHALTADSKWQVEVIWQDINTRAIEFCDEYGVSTEKDANGEVYSPGEGLNPFCFKLVNDSNTPGTQTYGNVLVGLKKLKSDGTPLDGYCWSWHLWITDYNPDKATPYDGSAQIWQTNNEIDLQGEYVSSSDYDKSFTNTSSSSLIYHRVHWGNVQHYNSLWDWYWETNPKSANVWDNGGIYANKWIMDRNLGAISCNVGNEYEPLDGWGMYYQYGRKDPFSYKIVYDITGKQKKFNYENPGVGSPQWNHINGQAANLSEAIMYPKNYYAKALADGVSWVNDGPHDNDWYSPTKDPMNPTHEKYKKTLFDPCPPGWCVPSVAAFDFASYAFDPISETVPSNYTFGEEMSGTVRSTDFAYARYYANDLEYNFNAYKNPNDPYAHTAVTVHVDVEGTYNSDMTNIDIDESPYNNTITKYRDRERMFATIYSTTPYNGPFKALKSVFPLQGRISGDGTSTAGTLGALNSLKDSKVSYYTYINGDEQEWFPNYNCGNEQGCLWTLDNGGDSRQATLILFQPVTLNNRINARQEVSGGRLFLRFHGYMRTANWLKARGQNVRCIQEPD